MWKRVLKNLTAVACFYVVLGVVSWWVFPARFAKDVREASAIANYVADHFAFSATSKVVPDRKPVFSDAGGRFLWLIRSPHRVKIYTVTESTAQNEIIELVRDYRSEKGLRPIIVTFYREENYTFRTNHDGRVVGGSRGEEVVLREVKLK